MTTLPPELLAQIERNVAQAPPPGDRLKADLRALLSPLPEPERRKAS